MHNSSLVFLKTYKVRKKVSSLKSGEISLPPTFIRNFGIDNSQKVACYIGGNGDLIYSPDRRDLAGRVFIRMYKTHRVGGRGLSIIVPRPFLEAQDLQVGDFLDCYLTNYEVFYRKHTEKDGKA